MISARHAKVREREIVTERDIDQLDDSFTMDGTGEGVRGTAANVLLCEIAGSHMVYCMSH